MNNALLKSLLATSAVAAILAAPAAFAQTDSAAPAPVDFKTLDKNADGALTADEIPADHPLAKDFAKADANGDGKLSQAEFDAYQPTGN
jgi:opacity protein-like surface antigen